MKHLLAFALLFSVLITWSQKKQSTQQLQQDLRILEVLLTELHPQPYRFQTEEELQSLFDHYHSLVEAPISHYEFFQVISAIMSSIGEAHTHANISETLKTELRGAALFPLDLHFQNRIAFIKKDLTGRNQDLIGSELVSINGVKITDIMNQIDSISCEGSGFNQSRIYRKFSFKRNFALAYYLFVGQKEDFKIQYLSPETQEVKELHLEGVKPDFEVKFTMEKDDAIPPFSLEIDKEKGYAFMQITTFAHWAIDYKVKDYEVFFAEAFESISDSKINHLIIDVRDNRGGSEYAAAQLLRYIATEPFFIANTIFTKNVKNEIVDSLELDTRNYSKKDYLDVDSGYVKKNQNVLKLQTPISKNHFDGKVYVLTNGNCFSACNIFMALVDEHTFGTIIGEESGGNYHDTDGYDRLEYTLPASGVPINIPLWHLKTAAKNGVWGHGVFPDVEVQYSIEDILEGRDPQLQKTLELIEANE